ncbi:hypothetical protein AVEN_233657-1 [Araneus ventricosus]|uniref:Transposase Tc1-like domain-containing protein n=1 Tax=Araneus ventricosus TaxID=182803 RepID=A0A4Y2UTM9_ARAVE|nr:hypothetical protein AVEN_233657-1 [Araneus ventricosus]
MWPSVTQNAVTIHEVFKARAKVTNIAKTQNCLASYTIQNQRRGTCGAPRAIDDGDERRLWRCVRANRRATVEQLTAQMNQGATKSVSSTKVQRTLLRMGLRSRHLVNAPTLTAVHRRRRRGDIQLTVYVRGSKSTRMSLPYSPGQQTHRV